MEQWNMGDSTGRWENFLGRKAGSRPGGGRKRNVLATSRVYVHYGNIRHKNFLTISKYHRTRSLRRGMLWHNNEFS